MTSSVLLTATVIICGTTLKETCEAPYLMVDDKSQYTYCYKGSYDES